MSRFELNCKLGLVNGEEPLCKCLLDDGKHKSYREWVDLLNNIHDLNEVLFKDNSELIKDNFELQGLLGDVRALLRLSKVDDAISRIDKFERSMKK